MGNNKPHQSLLGVRDDFRKVDFEEYRNGCPKELLQQFLDGKLGEDTPIETLRGLMYGYTFTEEYASGFMSSPFSVRYWEDILDDEEQIDSYQCQCEQIMNTLLSTGDGSSPETAFCVIDTYQEYELMQELFVYNVPKRIRQSVSEDGIDCIELEPNDFGVEKLYFDVHRRFEVGYPEFPDDDFSLDDDLFEE